MTPEEIQQVVEDYRKSSQSLNEFLKKDEEGNIKINLGKLRNFGRHPLDVKDNKDNKEKNNKGAQGTQGGTTGSQGTQVKPGGAQGSQVEPDDAEKNINIGTQQGAQGGLTGAQGVGGSTGTQDNQNKNKIDTSKEIESDANYAKSNAKFNQRFKDANTDTSNEIESDANYAKSNLRFNRASKGLPPVKRPRVPSPMDMLNPGGVKVKARFKAREAQGLSGLTGKPKFEAYDVVLDYVLSEGHADTLDEAHYVMMQMDENTIQQIIEMSSP